MNKEVEALHEKRKQRQRNVALGKDSSGDLRIEEGELRKCDGSVKRNSALVKRVRTLGTAPDAEKESPALIAEIAQLNSTKYVTELATAASEARPLRPSDSTAFVKVCAALHERYADFAPALSGELIKQFRAAIAPIPAAAAAAMSAQEVQQRPIKLRALVRLMLELFLAGVISDPAPALSAFNQLVKLDIGAGDSAGFENLPVILSFLRNAAEEVLGIVSPARKEVLAAYSREYGNEVGQSLVSPEHRDAVAKIARNYFGRVSSLLVVKHKELQDTEEENRRLMGTIGFLTDAQTAAYESQRKAYEKLLANTSALSDALQEPMPSLPEAQNVTRISGDLTVVERPKGDSNAVPVDPRWGDEETRAFYEDLPSLGAVPAVLLQEDVTVKELTGDDDSAELDGADSAKPPAQETTAKEGAPPPAPSAATAMATMATVGARSINEVIERLPKCESKDTIDKLAEEFCYINNKRNRVKLVAALFGPLKTAGDMFPYYSRFLAILAPHMPDIGTMLVEKLHSEFKQLAGKKAQIDLDPRVRNAKFISELTKFRVCPKEVTFDCIQVCLDDFAHHNIDIVCCLFENCGRFLARSPETAVRTKNTLDVLMRLKKVKSLDPFMEALVENAYYYCLPPENRNKPRKKRTHAQEYVRHLLYTVLTTKTASLVVRQLRKMNWTEMEEYIADCFVRAYKARFSNFRPLAGVLAALIPYHPMLGMRVTDALMDEIVSGLERNEPVMQQKRIAHVKMFSELYNYFVIDTNLVFDTLYLILSYAHDPRAVASGLAAKLDGPSECFRIRLVCTILDTCGYCFTKGKAAKRLDKFLVVFQRYILGKNEIPADVIFAIEDCFEAIRPGVKRLTTMEEANAALLAILAEEKNLKIPIPHKPQSQSPKRAEQQPEVEEEDEEDEDEEDEEGAPEQAAEMSEGSSTESEDEEDDDDDDEDEDEDDEDEEEGDYDTEDEEAEEEATKKQPEEKKKARPIPVDEEFDRSFAKVLMENTADAARAQQQGRRKDPLNIIIPQSAIERPQLQTDGAQPPQQGGGGVTFTVLLKKGSTQKTKEIVVPTESPLVRTSQTTQQQTMQEKQELKRLVLESLETQQMQEEINEIQSSAPGTLGAAMAFPQRGRGGARGGHRGGYYRGTQRRW